MKRKPLFRTHNIEILSCTSGSVIHHGKTQPVVVATFRMGQNFIPLNVNISLDQAERLVEDLQTILKSKAPPGRKERGDTRKAVRDIFDTLR